FGLGRRGPAGSPLFGTEFDPSGRCRNRPSGAITIGTRNGYRVGEGIQRMSRIGHPSFKLGVVFCSLLMVGLLGAPASPQSPVSPARTHDKADPVLAARAAHQPDAPFSCMLRKPSSKAVTAEADVSSLSGLNSH